MGWLGMTVPRINVSPPIDATISSQSERKLRELYATDFALYECVIAHGGMAGIRGRTIAQANYALDRYMRWTALAG
jgi:hypothetical protein